MTLTIPLILPNLGILNIIFKILAITIGITNSIIRLKKLKIFSTNPTKLSFSGIIEIFCFDKTGTLTDEKVNYLGFKMINEKFIDCSIINIIKNKNDNNIIEMNNYENYDNNDNFLQDNENYTDDIKIEKIEKINLGFACCHMLTLYNNKLIGDPTEIATFYASNANIFKKRKNINEVNYGEEINIESEKKDVESGEIKINDLKDLNENNETNEEIIIFNGKEINILQRLEFSSENKRMGVIIKYNGDIFIITKGSPETIFQYLKKNKGENEENLYYKELNNYTEKGLRVLGLSIKKINNYEDSKNNYFTKYEFDMEFLCFMIFENKIKENTENVIDELIRSNIKPVMVN
jgi:cation-transporting ATPase 13A2